MKDVSTIKLRSAVFVVTTLAVGGLLLAAKAAHAADGDGVPRGATICTDQGQSDTGVWAYGHATHRAPVTWTVRAARMPGGSEVELVRRTAWELKTVLATALEPGPHYYRACMTNTSAGPVHYQLRFGPNGQLAFPKTGSHTAVLGVGGRACGEVLSGWLATAGRLTGSSDVPVRFGVRVTDGDGEVLREEAIGTATKVDQIVTPPVTESYEVCVTNTSQNTATVSWDLQRI